MCHPTKPRRVAPKGKQGTRPKGTLSIKEMLTKLNQACTRPSNQPIGTPSKAQKRTRGEELGEDSPAKKVCHSTQPQWVAQPGKEGSMTQPPLNQETNSTSPGMQTRPKAIGLGGSRGRGGAEPISTKEVTQAKMKHTHKVKKKIQEEGPQSGDTGRIKQKKVQAIIPNSGNTVVKRRKKDDVITQYFTPEKKSTDAIGKGTSNNGDKR